ALWTIRTFARYLQQILLLHRIERDLPASRDRVSVVHTSDINAYTLPSGRVLVTDGLLEALTPVERDIVMAHERSHREHLHTWWKLAFDIAAAVNPLMRPAARAIADMTERWADEDAARVADRRSVALTIGRIALLRTGSAAIPAAAATGGQVPQRVRALL